MMHDSCAACLWKTADVQEIGWWDKPDYKKLGSVCDVEISFMQTEVSGVSSLRCVFDELHFS